MTPNVPSIRLNTGHHMPIIGLGTFDARGEVMKATLRHALECGYRSIDTAYLYLNESSIGEELHEWISSGKIKREDLFVTSKLPPSANRKADVSRYLKKTLKDLQLDYLDLYLVHHPFAFTGQNDEDTEPKDAEGKMVLDLDVNHEEVWKEMEAQVDAKLVKAIGISNFNSDQIRGIMKVARIPPAAHQIEAHVYLQQKPLRELCDRMNIVSCAYGPLGAPYRAQDCTSEFPLLLKHPKVIKIAKNHSKTPAQVLLRFLTQKDFVVLPKSATPARIKENFELFDFEIKEEEMKELEDLDRGPNGRVLSFKTIFPGIENHPEYPFKLEY